MKESKSPSQMIKQGLMLSLSVGGIAWLLFFLSHRMNIGIPVALIILFIVGMGL